MSSRFPAYALGSLGDQSTRRHPGGGAQSESNPAAYGQSAYGVARMVVPDYASYPAGGHCYPEYPPQPFSGGGYTDVGQHTGSSGQHVFRVDRPRQDHSSLYAAGDVPRSRSEYIQKKHELSVARGDMQPAPPAMHLDGVPVQRDCEGNLVCPFTYCDYRAKRGRNGDFNKHLNTHTKSRTWVCGKSSPNGRIQGCGKPYTSFFAWKQHRKPGCEAYEFLEAL